MRRVAVISSASGSGKTTVGRELARRLAVPFHELDALHHGPGWTEASAEELCARVEPFVTEEEWVIDGSYRGKLGDLVLAAVRLARSPDPGLAAAAPQAYVSAVANAGGALEREP